MFDRIHILGASGSGTTTLAERLCGRLSHAHFDSDDFLWEKKFTLLKPREERLSSLRARLETAERWILSGAVIDWGNPLIPLFDLVIFVSVPDEVRLERLRRRERERHGESIQPGHEKHENFLEFMEWASLYEIEGTDVRSRRQQEEWLEQLGCPVLRVENRGSLEEAVDAAAAFLEGN